MAYFGFTWNVKTGYRELMRSPGVVAELSDRADRIAEAAGEGFVVDVEVESGRRRTPRSSVRTGTFDARLAQARNPVIERAIDAGR
jgi:hypothetical protein